MEKTAERVKRIRKLKNRSLHDCAKLLDISKEHYHHFEEGEGDLSLPEMELLAIFLEVPTPSLFEPSDKGLDKLFLLSDERKPDYKNIRNKIIQTKLNLEMDNQDISIDNLNQYTGIPLETLKSYQDNGTRIPFAHLTIICDHLGISIKSLLREETEENQEELIHEHLEQSQWQPEYHENENNDLVDEDTRYQEIFHAIKNLTVKDQAEIAKVLLEKLKAS